jgi:MFS family permease
MMTSICKEWYQFFLAQGILDGICMGLTMAPCMAATGQYFNKNRGAALGLAVAGSSVGGVVFPIALSKMLANEKLGFGWSVRICGFLMLAVVLPACAMVRARLPPRSGKFFLPSAFRELPYVCLIGSVFLIMLGLFTPFFYLPTFAVEHGMSTQLASYLVAILNGSSFFGRVLGGLLADKFGRLNLLMGAGVCTGVLIFCWQKMTTNATMILFAVLYGFFSGAIVSLMSAALAQVPKDARNIGTYMGMGMALVSIATLIGPPINGALVTRFGEFEQSSTMSGVFAVVGGLSVILTKFVSGKTFEKY